MCIISGWPASWNVKYLLLTVIVKCEFKAVLFQWWGVLNCLFHHMAGRSAPTVKITLPSVTSSATWVNALFDVLIFGSETLYRLRLNVQVGYELSGSTTRTCQASGDWSGQDTSCYLVVCPSLAVPRNGSKRFVPRFFVKINNGIDVPTYHFLLLSKLSCQKPNLWSITNHWKSVEVCFLVTLSTKWIHGIKVSLYWLWSSSCSGRFRVSQMMHLPRVPLF